MKAICFSLILGLVVSCTAKNPLSESEIVAKVNGNPVPSQSFLLRYEQLRREQDELSLKNPKIIDGLKNRALNEAIIANLVEQETTRRNITVDKEEVEGRLSNWKDGYPPGGFEEMLRTRNTTEAFLKKKIEEQLLVEKLIAEAFSAETLVSDEEMQAYHKDHSRDFFRPEKVHVYQIVVPTTEEATKIRQEILSGKIAFQSAARKYSLSPDAAKGGDLGFFSKNEKIPAFNKAFRLPVGEVSKPIQSRYGVHILKVTEKHRRKKLGYQAAKRDIAERLKKVKEARVYQEWLMKLLKEGKIFRNEQLLDEIS